MNQQVKYIAGGLAVDDRGHIQFCNDFDMTAIKRFYIVSNHTAPFIRAWHGHKKENKFVMVISGAAIFGAVKIDDWENPDHNAKVERFVLSAEKPGLLYIPAGYAHGYKTLVKDAKIMFFSTSTLKESSGDDFRFDYDFWNPWDVVPR